METAETKHFEVKLLRSGAGRSGSQRLTLKGIGLTRFGRTVYLKDTPAVRGMLYKVVHLVQVMAKAGDPPLSARGRAKSLAGAKG